MSLDDKIAQLGATDLLTITERLNNVIGQHEEAKETAWRIRVPGTAYNAGDKVIVPGVGNFDKILRCETAGTTADADFPEDYNALEIGDVINDGTVSWGVVNLVTMPDIEGAPVTSVNGKTGDVNLTAANVGAEPTGAVAGHEAKKASANESGHVKVDGETIVSENGVIKAVGGLPIGAIFPFPASIPPEGAYLLNGQTIANCESLYPKFYDWLTTAEIRTVTADEYEAELVEYGFCGAFVISGSSVRLPNYTNAFVMGGNDSNIGVNVAAGLPNVTGEVGAFATGDGDYMDGAFRTTNTSPNWYGNGYASVSWADFDASRSSDIYGNSDTVQPPAIRVSWCIQVYNAATVLSEQESAQLASQVQTKAQTDLGNVTNPTQAFKDMAIGWGMPDYSAGVDITASLTAANTEYTIPYDCMISVLAWGDQFVTILSRGGFYLGDENCKPYVILHTDSTGDASTNTNAYLPKGMKIYTLANLTNYGKIFIYPLKGAKR